MIFVCVLLWQWFLWSLFAVLCQRCFVGMFCDTCFVGKQSRNLFPIEYSRFKCHVVSCNEYFVSLKWFHPSVSVLIFFCS